MLEIWRYPNTYRLVYAFLKYSYSEILIKFILILETRRNVNFPKMQIGADSLTLTLTLHLLNPKSVGFDTVLRTTTLPSSKSLRSAVFVLSC